MNEQHLLVVDLDGTLIRSDMLLESFWNVASRDIVGALRALLSLRVGKAAFKERLAEAAQIDITRLPYNRDVLDLIETHRAAGGKTALVTASDHRFAEAIAAHLDCFDEVHGSDGRRNLKGVEKATFLEERFGAGNFDYAGDAEADLAVWKVAARAITVAVPPKQRQAVEAVAAQTLHLDAPVGSVPSGLPIWLKALRPHQWLKNLLVFLPPAAAHSTEPAIWFAAFMAFVTMSMVASSVYLFNDLLDLSADRAHERKCKRPLPSGDMDLLHGSLLAPALLLGGLVIALASLRIEYCAVLLVYFALTTAYSLSLKRKLIIDICTLAGLYTLRLIAGGVATDLTLSPWILALSVFLFLSLAAVKRQAELVSDASLGKLDGPDGRAYITTDIPIVTSMALSSGYIAVLVVALYINTPNVGALYDAPMFLWGICPVLLYWISRVVMLTHRGRMDDDPVIFALKDATSRWCGLLVAVLVILGATW